MCGHVFNVVYVLACACVLSLCCRYGFDDSAGPEFRVESTTAGPVDTTMGFFLEVNDDAVAAADASCVDRCHETEMNTPTFADQECHVRCPSPLCDGRHLPYYIFLAYLI
jgi:hypothetical protein